MSKPIKTSKLAINTTEVKDKIFIYQGLSNKGKKITGQICAPTLQMACLKLQKQGITRPRLRQKRQFLLSLKKIKSFDITLFFRQLATMLSAGIPLTQALAISEQNTKNAQLSAIINQIKTDIESGSNFATALDKHTAFGSLAIALVRAGEQSGSLDTMLSRIASHQENLENLKKQTQKSRTIPCCGQRGCHHGNGDFTHKSCASFCSDLWTNGQRLTLANTAYLGTI